MSAREAALIALIGTVLTACGASNDAGSPGSPSKGHADVTVTMGDGPHVCNVALAQEAQASSVACGEVVAFIRDELRLPSGAVVELRADRTTDAGALAAVSASLNSAGYRSKR
jgi:hypothetical protein